MLSTICFSSVRVASSASQWLAVFLQALLLTALILGAVALAVTFWAVIAQLFVGGALIALFALATFPRKAVRK